MLEDWGDMPSLVRDGFVPLADVEETDDAYLIELEVPGIKKGDVDIAVAGRRLTVTGERKEKERAGILRRRTRSVGRFHFEIELPEAIDGNGVSASLGDGVLTVRAPKAVAERARKVEVK